MTSDYTQWELDDMIRLHGIWLENPSNEKNFYMRIDKPHMNFSGLDFREARLTGATLHDCNFAGANLQNCDLSNMFLHGCNFTGAAMQGANLQDSDLRGVVT